MGAVLEKCRHHREKERQSNIRHFKPTFTNTKFVKEPFFIFVYFIIPLNG
ncbi:hypothetical protein [Paenibacillus sp. yr247]|nr:hypothetical protein [Paenibacillus sp. yr247]